MRIEICGAESMIGNADASACFGAATRGAAAGVCAMYNTGAHLGAVLNTGISDISCNAPGVGGKSTLER